jgi:hypothetical protein
MGPRNIYIAFLVFAAILVPGAILFRHSEMGSQAVFIASFGGGLLLLNVLDARQRSREGRE